MNVVAQIGQVITSGESCQLELYFGLRGTIEQIDKDGDAWLRFPSLVAKGERKQDLRLETRSDEANSR